MSFFFQRKWVSHLSVSALVLLMGVFAVARAQSGRRATKPQSVPVPVAPELPTSVITETTASPRTGKLHQKVQLKIARHLTKKHLQSEDAIFASFVNRLKSYENIVASTLGDVKRPEAVMYAKGETESLVVLLSFEIDNVQNGTVIINSPDLEVQYQIFEPRTGKKLNQGKIYFQAIGGARMRRSEWPSGTPIKITAEAAGIEAADHVHDWLRLDEARKRAPDK
jgi:hypothetical protein